MQKVRLLAIEEREWRDSFWVDSDNDVEMYHQILSLLSNLTEIVLVLGDIRYESLLSPPERWASRPHDEIELIDAKRPSVPLWVEAMVAPYNEKFPRGAGVKLTMKEILRGGVIPESVERFRR